MTDGDMSGHLSVDEIAVLAEGEDRRAGAELGARAPRDLRQLHGRVRGRRSLSRGLARTTGSVSNAGDAASFRVGGAAPRRGPAHAAGAHAGVARPDGRGGRGVRDHRRRWPRMGSLAAGEPSTRSCRLRSAALELIRDGARDSRRRARGRPPPELRSGRRGRRTSRRRSSRPARTTSPGTAHPRTATRSPRGCWLWDSSTRRADTRTRRDAARPRTSASTCSPRSSPTDRAISPPPSASCGARSRSATATRSPRSAGARARRARPKGCGNQVLTPLVRGDRTR